MKLEVVNGLTQFTRDSIGEFNKRMIITFTNDGWVKKNGIDAYIDNAVFQGINFYEWDRKLALAIGEYWKYVFHICEDNILEEDKELAMKCLKKSYKLGSGDAAAQLGYYYYIGKEIVDEPKMKKARKLFREARDRGFFMGSYIIAKALASAVNNPAAQRASAQQYEVAIKRNIPYDKNELAEVYLRMANFMIEENDEKAEEYINKSLKYFNLDENRNVDRIKECNLILKNYKSNKIKK